MKTITLNVSEPVYNRLRYIAKRKDRTASELIREIMERYVEESEAVKEDSVLSFLPTSCGVELRPLAKDDDLFEELLDG